MANLDSVARRVRGRTAWTAGAALLALALVGAAVAMGRGEALDAAITRAIRAGASPPLDAVARAFTALASGPVTLAAVAAWAVAEARRGDRRAGGMLAVAWCASALLAAALKQLFGRARPSFPYTFEVVSTPAFPSGHSMNAVVVWGLFAIVAARRRPRFRPAWALAAGALALGAGWSRVYLGVHWPTDVLGGWAAGLALLAALAPALPAGETRRR